MNEQHPTSQLTRETEGHSRPEGLLAPEREPQAPKRPDAGDQPSEPSTTAPRRRRWPWLLLLVAVAIGGIFAGRHYFQHPGPAKRTAQQEVQPVGAAKIVSGDIDETLTGLGTVTPLATVTVQTQINGQLMSVGFKRVALRERRYGVERDLSGRRRRGWKVDAVQRAPHVRSGLDWTDKYPATAAALAELQVKSAYLDGELCVVREDGVTSFELMQQASDAGSGGLAYFAFDLLELDGEDISRLPLLERKDRLGMPLDKAPAGIVYSEHEGGDGEAFPQGRLQARP